MEFHCGRYLSKYVDRGDIKPSYNQNSNKAMVIVESRCGYWLPLVIRNAVDKLPGWNLYVVGKSNVIEFVQREVGGRFIPMVLDVPGNITIPIYNQILMDHTFWQRFAEKHILVFQMDCIILREPTGQMLMWDYIGPLCGEMREDRFIMNGGLSLRNKTSMVMACQMFTEEERKKPEDVAFTECMRRNPMFVLPGMKECNDFGLESMGNHETIVGIHGTDKYYTDIYEKLFANVK